MRSLNEFGAPDVQVSRQDDNAYRRLELAKWLSDWHLIAFLGTSGLLSEVGFYNPSLPAEGCSVLVIRLT